MKMTNEEYGKYVRKMQPKSRWLANSLKAYLVGGLICVLGQGLHQLYTNWGAGETEAGSWVSVTLIVLAALLTGFGVYDDIARFAGAGTLVPITGFANAMVSPALEFKREGMILGTAAKMFTIAGPVIVYGLSASVVYGFIYWITTLF